MESLNNEFELRPPAKRRKTEDDGGQQKMDWRAIAGQNLSKISSSGYKQTHNRNVNQFQQHQQQNFFDNNQFVQNEKSIPGELAAREVFVAFLQDLLSRKISGAELIQDLHRNGNAMDEFIRNSLKLIEFQPMLQILGQVCGCNAHQNRAILISRVCQPEFLCRFPIMLVECSSISGNILELVASDMVLLFATIASLLPLTAVRFKPSAQSCLSSLQGMQKHGVPVPERLIIKFGEVLKDLQELQLKTPSGSNSSIYFQRRKEQVDKMRYSKPPDDFRQINIYPSKEDILCAEPPFLRPNIVDGPYEDVEQYLDVQFRLLREDFVRPLREGVQDVISRTDSRRCDSLSVRVYRNVKFLKFVRELDSRVKVVTEGVLLCFDSGTENKWKQPNWEHSKRFLYGGLVCFTCNNFQTILFATIAGRDLKYLEKGQLLVSFCQPYSENIYNRDYIMIESEIFFEPYYQVLKSLQRLNEHTFPMAHYFVKIEKLDYVPKYLNMNVEDEEGNMNMDESEVEINIIDVEGRQRSTLPLFPHTWPSGEDLGLDPSQYLALKAALTRELVVIQGPPGTGKTFMALKIAGILIENKVQMGRKTPILVLCLTNHALDQFLVGMLKFTDNLVRIGGQSKENKMDQFNLKNQRFRRNKEHYQLSTLINTSYKQLEQVEATLYGVSYAVSKQGFLMDAAVCELDVSHLQFSEWLVGEALSHLVAEYFSEEKETRFISFDAMKNIAVKMKRENIEAIQKKCVLSPKTKETQADKEEAAHQELIKSLDDMKINLEKLVEIDDLHKLKATKPLNLTSNQRLCLYMLSVRSKKDALEIERTSLVNTIADAKNKIEDLKNRDQVNFLKGVDVIGLTTNGAARLHKMLGALMCEIVIVEEAAEVMESHIVACVSKSCSHLILIGDHKQLRPNVSVYELGKYYNFDISLFERMVMNRKGCVTLQVQHRMAPEIAKLIVPTIYEKLENHKSVLSLPNVPGLVKRLYFLSHSHREMQDRENSSRTNEFEANFLMSLCKRLIWQGYKPKKITILSTYKGQMFLLKRKIRDEKSRSSNVEGLQDVLVTVVDNYQGEENDIILLSLVRSNSEGRIGFLATENRVCVALSRAKQGLFIVGNMDMLAANNKTWQEIRKSLQDQDAIGSSMPLRCEIHPDQIVNVASTHDFTNLTPYDGCNKICDERLNCGHDCTSKCHLIHFGHSHIKCQSPCERKCDAGLHSCKLKCYMSCGSNCWVRVEKGLPCGHVSMVECKKDPEKVTCVVAVEKVFPNCNHTGTVACSIKICPNACNKQVPCGHSCTHRCHINDDPDHMHYICKKPCLRMKKQCSTGQHPCLKMCYDNCNICEELVKKRRSCGHSFKSVKCHQDIEIVSCTENCRKSLACGHFCTGLCKEDCYPCLQIV